MPINKTEYEVRIKSDFPCQYNETIKDMLKHYESTDLPPKFFEYTYYDTDALDLLHSDMYLRLKKNNINGKYSVMFKKPDGDYTYKEYCEKINLDENIFKNTDCYMMAVKLINNPLMQIKQQIQILIYRQYTQFTDKMNSKLKYYLCNDTVSDNTNNKKIYVTELELLDHDMHNEFLKIAKLIKRKKIIITQENKYVMSMTEFKNNH